MLRFFFSLVFFSLFANGLNAQTTNGSSTERLTTQQLTPTEALFQQETKEVDGFERKLASLKTAFSEKDASRMVAYEAYLQGAMRKETEQMAQKNASSPSVDTQARLEQMNKTMEAFEAHTFHTLTGEAAARDFALLDAFLQIMKAELAELKRGQD